jgi:hypothetical protein
MYYQLLKRPYQVQSFKIFNECVYSISHLKTDDGESKVRDDLKKCLTSAPMEQISGIA